MPKLYLESLRIASKKNWSWEVDLISNPGKRIPDEQIQLGAILRIADAMDDIAKDYRKLRRRCEYLENQNERYQKKIETLLRRIAGLKGNK